MSAPTRFFSVVAVLAALFVPATASAWTARIDDGAVHSAKLRAVDQTLDVAVSSAWLSGRIVDGDGTRLVGRATLADGTAVDLQLDATCTNVADGIACTGELTVALAGGTRTVAVVAGVGGVTVTAGDRLALALVARDGARSIVTQEDVDEI